MGRFRHRATCLSKSDGGNIIAAAGSVGNTILAVQTQQDRSPSPFLHHIYANPWPAISFSANSCLVARPPRKSEITNKMPAKSENQEPAPVTGPMSVLTPREQAIMLQSILTIKGFPSVSPNPPISPILPSVVSAPIPVKTCFSPTVKSLLPSNTISSFHPFATS